METKQDSLSLKIIYWVTQISFWLFVVAGLIMIGIAFGLIFNLFSNDLNLHVGLPVAFDLTETGKLQLLNKSIPVTFEEAYGKIGFSELPTMVGRIYGIFILLVIGIFFYIFQAFRRIILNVYKGLIFKIGNFKLLRNMAYGLLAFWAMIVVYSLLQHFMIAQHLTFESLSYAGSMEFHTEVVFVALILLVLSHIFMHGIKLKEDNELTI